MNLIETDEITTRYVDADDIESDCLDITFYNAGTKTCMINSFPLITGASKVVSCNGGEILKARYQIRFDTAALGTQSVFVMRRTYKRRAS